MTIGPAQAAGSADLQLTNHGSIRDCGTIEGEDGPTITTQPNEYCEMSLDYTDFSNTGLWIVAGIPWGGYDSYYKDCTAVAVAQDGSSISESPASPCPDFSILLEPVILFVDPPLGTYSIIFGSRSGGTAEIYSFPAYPR